MHNPQPLASCDAAGPRIRTWRMRTVLDFHQGGLGAISSSRCQTTRARTGEPARARIFLGFWTSRTGARGALHKRAAAFHRPNLRAEFTGPNLRGPRLCARQRQVRVALDRLPIWWSQTGSNRRPPACKAGALPTELWPPSGIRDQISEVSNQKRNLQVV